MNILYLHGLNGSLSHEKREILEQYGKVFSPEINYNANPDSIKDLSEWFNSYDITVVIGSSMGGFAGYYVSNIYKCPALLFNPALAERSIYQSIPQIKSKISSFKQIVLGTQDEVVNPKLTLSFIAETLSHHPEYKVNIHHNLAHRIPLNIFKEEVTLFFERMITPLKRT